MSSGCSASRVGRRAISTQSGVCSTTQSRKTPSSLREAGNTDRNLPPRVWMCRQLSKLASLESATYAALRIMPSLLAKSQVRTVSALIYAA